MLQAGGRAVRPSEEMWMQVAHPMACDLLPVHMPEALQKVVLRRGCSLAEPFSKFMSSLPCTEKL